MNGDYNGNNVELPSGFLLVFQIVFYDGFGNN